MIMVAITTKKNAGRKSSKKTARASWPIAVSSTTSTRWPFKV